jgi:import inner membrane translocase subunit TIM23
MQRTCVYFCRLGNLTPVVTRFQTSVRFASTTSNTKNNDADRITLGRQHQLTWNEYFALRRKRILRERITTVPTTIIGLAGGIAYFGTRSVDVTTTVLGMDPFIMYSLGAVACGFFGFLMGPVVASSLWRMSNKKVAQAMDEVSCR